MQKFDETLQLQDFNAMLEYSIAPFEYTDPVLSLLSK